MNARTVLSLPLLLVGAALVLEAAAVSGPQFRSLRGLSMGNAFVALADDKEAMYYNPAGLNLINAVGNVAARPALADYPRDRIQARVNVGATTPGVSDMLDFFRFFKDHRDAFESDSAMRADETLVEDLAAFHRRPMEFGVLHSAVFAMHNYGAAYWIDSRVAPYVAMGPLLPQAGIETIQIDAVVQVAGARSFMNDRLAAGAAYRVANRRTVRNFEVAAGEFAEDGGSAVIDRVEDTLYAKLDGLTEVTSYGHGVDVGALWQQTPWLRVGGSLQNFGMFLNDEFVTPELTVGAAVTPPLLSSGGLFPRKVNVALDFEDILNSERNYRFFSKINVGAEVEQRLWWTLGGRAAAGLKGGYWTAGLGLSLLSAVHIEYASWAEEVGDYTGHIEQRYHALRVGVGL